MGFFDIFKSKKRKAEESNNSRIFSAVLERLMCELVTDRHDAPVVYQACLVGGKAMANELVQKCNYVKEAWGKGDEEKALALIKVFTLHMLSHWCRSLDRYVDSGKDRLLHPGKDAQRQFREIAALDILRLFRDHSEQSVKDFMNFDLQFNWELDNKELRINLTALLLVKALEACGQSCVDWPTLTLPIPREWRGLSLEQRSEVEDYRATIYVPTGNRAGYIMLEVCESIGVKAMFDYSRSRVSA